MKAVLKSFTPSLSKEGEHKSWIGKTGISYYDFKIEFEDGTKGVAASTKKEPSWHVQKEYGFEIEVRTGFPDKIKGMREIGVVYDKKDEPRPLPVELKRADEDLYISKLVAYEQATITFKRLDQTSFDDVVKVKLMLEALANKYFNYLIASDNENISVRQQRIIKSNALKRSIEQIEIPLLQINSSDKVIERAKEIVDYILKIQLHE